ncbi:MAG: hypothetical protein AMXMBFR84_38190 [Candidatus Hydrogenedentota bacterium]
MREFHYTENHCRRLSLIPGVVVPLIFCFLYGCLAWSDRLSFGVASSALTVIGIAVLSVLGRRAAMRTLTAHVLRIGNDELVIGTPALANRIRLSEVRKVEFHRDKSNALSRIVLRANRWPGVWLSGWEDMEGIRQAIEARVRHNCELEQRSERGSYFYGMVWSGFGLGAVAVVAIGVVVLPRFELWSIMGAMLTFLAMGIGFDAFVQKKTGIATLRQYGRDNWQTLLTASVGIAVWIAAMAAGLAPLGR